MSPTLKESTSDIIGRSFLFFVLAFTFFLGRSFPFFHLVINGVLEGGWICLFFLATDNFFSLVRLVLCVNFPGRSVLAFITFAILPLLTALRPPQLHPRIVLF